jgi:hypothetical protein
VGRRPDARVGRERPGQADPPAGLTPTTRGHDWSVAVAAVLGQQLADEPGLDDLAVTA